MKLCIAFLVLMFALLVHSRHHYQHPKYYDDEEVSKDYDFIERALKSKRDRMEHQKRSSIEHRKKNLEEEDTEDELLNPKVPTTTAPAPKQTHRPLPKQSISLNLILFVINNIRSLRRNDEKQRNYIRNLYRVVSSLRKKVKTLEEEGLGGDGGGNRGLPRGLFFDEADKDHSVKHKRHN